MFRAWMVAVAVFLFAATPSQVIAQEKSAVREGFTLPTDRPARILVFQPDVQVGSQSTGGVEEPNAEWTETARRLLAESLAAAQAARGNEIVTLPELQAEDAALLADYRSMFRVVTGEVVQYRLFPGNRLPTKRDQLDWTLGPGVSRLAELGGADYGLFIYTHDAYGSTGRKVAQVFAAAFLGVGISSGVHIGYAGLVDLRTGELLWVNADLQMGGDVREPDGAARRIEQLLEDFPGRPAPAPAPAATPAR